MAEVINLRQKRKEKGRKQKEKTAAQNRVVHGRTNAEKQRGQQEAERASRLLDGHKKEDD